MELQTETLTPGTTGHDSGACVELRQVSMTFETGRRRTEALHEISFSVRDEEFITLIGPSGCGKTTVLRMIADIIKPSSGQVIVLGGSPHEARRQRMIGFVFQNPALLGWRTVLHNTLLPAEVMGLKNQEERALELLELVGLQGFEDHYPDELSGGMQQRVAIARALSFDPKILLMDEPFGALDLITRERMSQELLRIWEQTHKTVLFVTHSIQEAVFLSDKVLVMSARPGAIVAEVPINLPRPRSLDMRNSDEFENLTRMMRGILL